MSLLSHSSRIMRGVNNFFFFLTGYMKSKYLIVRLSRLYICMSLRILKNITYGIFNNGRICTG